jgi:hypothetical protein
MPNSSADTGAPNLESYTDNGDFTVTDNVTHLMWQNDGLSQSSQHDAITYCINLRLGCHSDWRLPSVIELFSIEDYGKTFPSINGIFSPPPAGVGGTFWTSSLPPGAPDYGWSVDFTSGYANNGLLTDMRYVRCVR